MRILQALAARFCQPSRLSTAVASARPLAFPGAAAAASAFPPAAPPWAWATSGAGPSTGCSSSSGVNAPFASWGAAWRSALGVGGSGVPHMPAGQQLGGVRGLGAAGSFGLRPTASHRVPKSATSRGSCSIFSGPSAAAWSWSGAFGSRTGRIPNPAAVSPHHLAARNSARGVAGGVRPGAPCTASWTTFLTGALAVVADVALICGALVVGSYVNSWYKHLEQVPYSGRWRSVRPTVAEDFQQDTAVHRSKGELLPDDHLDVLLVRRLGAAVVEAAVKGLGDGAAAERLRGLQWEFCVVDDGQASNASIVPGGKVIVRQSLLEKVNRDEDLLAFVLAHEVAHEVAQHAAERQSNVIYAWAAVLLAAVAKLRTAWLIPGMVLAVDKLFASEGVWNVLRPLSWYMEFEADAIAMQLMARAGFNPGAGVIFGLLSTLSGDRGSSTTAAASPGADVMCGALSSSSSTATKAKAEEGSRYLLSKVLPELASTHPSWASRTECAVKQLPAACRAYTDAGFGTCEPDECLRRAADRCIIAKHAKIEAAMLRCM